MRPYPVTEEKKKKECGYGSSGSVLPSKLKAKFKTHYHEKKIQ
jgi:hypothetical protein